MTKQNNALRLATASNAMADEGELIHLLSWHEIRNLLRANAAELRRLHAECEALRDGARAMHSARWYMVNKDGMATLCTDRADAEKEAEDAQSVWPHMGPHRAVQLVEVDSIEASAGSEPVIGWRAFPHYLQHPDGRLLRTASDLLARHGYQGCAEPLRAMSDVLLPTNPSPPEGMVGGWTKASQQLPPCRDDQLYLGINTAGFAGVFNAVRVINGNTYCLMEVSEESVSIMSDLDIWQPFTPPTTSAGSGKGGES